jgi:hypothetical protein
MFHVRHEMGVKHLGGALRMAGFQVSYEPPLHDFLPQGMAGSMRLDIMARRGTKVMGIDFTRVATDLQVSETNKRAKYSGWYQAMGVPFHPVAVSTLGCPGPASSELLEWLVGQVTTSDHPHAARNPRAHLSGCFQFGQARALRFVSRKLLSRSQAFVAVGSGSNQGQH